MNMNRPHPDGFPALYLRVMELDRAATTNPDGLLANERFSPGARDIVHEWYRANDHEEQRIRRLAQDQELLAAGVSQEVLDNPVLRAALDDGMFTLRHFQGVLGFSLHTDEYGNWRPHRSTVAEMCAGAFVASGGKTRTEAADLLHPPRDRSEHVTGSNIRDGLARFGQDFARNVGCRPARLEVYVSALALRLPHTVWAGRALWDEYYRAKGNNRMSRFVETKIHSGQIFRDWDRVSSETPLPAGALDRGTIIVCQLLRDNLNLADTPEPQRIRRKPAGGSAPASA